MIEKIKTKLTSFNAMCEKLSQRADIGQINMHYDIPTNEINISICCFWLTEDVNKEGRKDQDFFFKGKLPDLTRFEDFLETIDRRKEVTHLVETAQIGWYQNPMKVLPLITKKATGSKDGQFQEQRTTHPIYSTIWGELLGDTHATPMAVDAYRKARNEFFVHEFKVKVSNDNGTKFELELYNTPHCKINPKIWSRLLKKAFLIKERISELNIYDDMAEWEES
jgi:hypothetical protein